MDNNKDTRWVGALALGVIGVATFWTVFVPIICALAIRDMYEN